MTERTRLPICPRSKTTGADVARAPRIDSPCPVADRPLPAGASDHCSLCDRQVHNLDRMSGRERREFMSACGGKVCVAYTIKLPARLRGAGSVAALAALALTSLPAAAGGPDDAADDATVGAMSPLPGNDRLPFCDDLSEVVVTGGVTRADQAEWVDDGTDAPPELPTMEDDGR
jgi:hypothetical protein